MLTDEQVEQLKALRVKYPGNRMEKFAIDPRAHEAVAVEVAKGLGLHRLPRQKILDLGCGFGYFIRECETLGHWSVGVDMPNRMISEACGILGKRLVRDTIKPFTRMVRFPAGYDFITMFGVNLHDGTEYWDVKKYTFLANDIRRYLWEGAWVIRPNAPVGNNSPTADLMDPAWWQKVAGPDAEITTAINHSFQVTIRWKPST